VLGIVDNPDFFLLERVAPSTELSSDRTARCRRPGVPGDRRMVIPYQLERYPQIINRS
jgi:hypothetical protein